MQSRYYDSFTGRFISSEPNIDFGGFDESAEILTYNIYAYCANRPVVFCDPTGEALFTCILVGAVIGAVVGSGVGAAISYSKYKKVKWKYVVFGGVGGAAIGAVFGAGIHAIGVTAKSAISTGTYKTLSQGVNFTKTTLSRMTDKARYVPVQLLIEAIKKGVARPDPQKTRAIMYTIQMVKNGKTYILEVLYDKATNTILHFLYK